MTEQKQETAKPTENKKQKITENAFGEKIVVNEIGWSWGLISFYLSLVAVFLVIYFMYSIFSLNSVRDPNISMGLLIFSVFVVPIITLGIIFGTLIGTIGVKFKSIKDKNYLLMAICISVIVLVLYIIPWVLPWIHKFFGL